MQHLLGSLDPSWQYFFQAEFQAEYITQLRTKLNADYRKGLTILPPIHQIFRAFEIVGLNEVKVIILGQDPYHRRGQAHGLSFSVAQGISLPPSLINIYKEIESDCQINMNYQNGDLTHRARQGVLLLNASLTVLESQANSHATYGWHILTDHLISYLSNYHDHLVYMLRGNFAKQKINLIDQHKHCILTSSHPSPLSVFQGFQGCHHFSACNRYLAEHDKKVIDWKN